MSVVLTNCILKGSGEAARKTAIMCGILVGLITAVISK
jgi:hypothetical protein